jgi:hypothetical protein
MIALVAAVMALAVYAAFPAFAVHDTGVFELDKNAVQDSPPAEDWQNVCDETNSRTPTCLDNSTANAHTFETDVAGQSIFTGAQSGGSSKDAQRISGWRWKSGSVPDKDEILHGYAARYSKSPSTTCPAGTNPTCELLFFGADRFDASGDAQLGFWFYQSKVACVPPAGGSDCASNDSVAHTFAGEHVDGDILVLSDFVGGGETPSIKAFYWNFDPTPNSNLADDGAIAGGGSGKCSNHVCDDLIPLFDITNADCASAQAHDGACAVVNTGTETSPWNFTDKSGNSDFAAAEFYEGGINLSLLPGGFASECFSSFSVETRSSATPDAVLKDFVLGDFGNCVPSVSTSASSTGQVFPGTAVHDTATITISGSGSRPDPTGTVTFYLCGPSTSDPDCTSGGTSIGTGALGNQSGGTTTDGIAVATSPDVNTAASPLASGHYCFGASWSGDATYGTFNPALRNTDNTGECFEVGTVATTTTTRQFVYPQDRAKVAATSGGNLVGTLTFRLFGATAGGNTALQNCNADVTSGGTSTGGLIHTESVSIASSASPQTRRTNNTSDAVTASGTYYWHVLFDSTNPNQDDSESACVENTVYTFNGDDSSITVPGVANP